MSYDLMLDTHADRELAPHDFEMVQEAVRNNATLERLCEVTPGRFAASEVDAVVLEEGLDFGDFSETEFAQFCSKRGLPANRRDPEAACAFVRSKFGFTVASFKLPRARAEAEIAYAEIVRLALHLG